MEIRAESYGSPAARELAAALARELRTRYDGEDGAGGEPPATDFDPPQGTFLVAYAEGEPVGCGGICRYDGLTAELRRMYVEPSARGRGLARELLAGLEEAARRLGYSALRLETGSRQPEAFALYRSACYATIPCYGPYATDPLSLCLEKRLDRR